ncbi:rhamnan synthesis F family protein [Variovorax sp. NFACC27]|uniref:rhamnan synthesis F family protein n=1 Tax=unclassified Variovorax TaxID=663243 RepID=UPI0008966B62|nr:Rhamnan synthesis protein F [Variovorax sp. NFACC28]SEG96271.1 Rhamnan synthesis protein F [Variovorax sp. NFACC29]SFD83281.1 Rhamnan synthesis protein F [Variovorax sp. NFACC26]SFG95223.1 Rhamnan synthesis protein F [Variovorax sp. NFACC27]
MRGLLRMLRAMATRLAYHSYCTATKIRQWPLILRERRPAFLSDESQRPARGDVYAIVVKYAKFGLAPDFLDLLQSLEAGGVNAIVVCNGKLDAASHALLLRSAHRVLVRRNVGRDMGAYRAATLYLGEQGLEPGRMLYLNDSIFFLKSKELDDLVEALCQRRFDVTGAFENHEKSHHVGSYALAVSGKVFSDPDIQRFWQRYRPYDLRPHAILHGEVALSACLKQGGYSIDVIYGAEKLVHQLNALDLRGLIALTQVMRPAFRLQPLDGLMAQSMAALRLVEPLSVSSQARPAAAAAAVEPVAPVLTASGTPTLASYRARRAQLAQQAPPPPPAPVDDQSFKVAEALARRALVDRIMMEVTQGSQIHLGFGLFRTLMRCPIVKKDLIARDIYFEHDCEMILQDVESEMRSMIVREMVNRGRPIFAQGRLRFLLDHGLV